MDLTGGGEGIGGAVFPCSLHEPDSEREALQKQEDLASPMAVCDFADTFEFIAATCLCGSCLRNCAFLS